MTQTPTIHTQGSDVSKLLILSDGKPGHVNQSVAFAKLLDLPFEVRRVSFCNRLYLCVFWRQCSVSPVVFHFSINKQRFVLSRKTPAQRITFFALV